MTSIKRLSEEIRSDAVAKEASSPKKARGFLHSAGIITTKGTLASAYKTSPTRGMDAAQRRASSEEVRTVRRNPSSVAKKCK